MQADPTADVAGLDAIEKQQFYTSSIAFNTRVKFRRCKVEGITNITPEDITYAKIRLYCKLLQLQLNIQKMAQDVAFIQLLLIKIIH